jgi:PAS domain S-box-containing protein
MASRPVPSSPAAWPAAIHLALLASIIALPLLALLGSLLYRTASVERRQVEQRLVQVAEDLVADLDRDIDRHFTILTTLISSRSLAGEDYAGFHARATLSLRDKGHVVLIDAQGQQLVNTFLPFGQAPRLTGNPEMLETIRRTHRPVVSDLFTGLASREVVFNIAIPILEGDQLRYVLSLSLRPSAFQSLLAGQGLPPQWNTSIWDGNGLIVARSRDDGRLIGTRMPSRLRDGERQLQAYESTGIDGAEILHAFARSRFSAWSVGVSAPAATIQGQVRQSVWLWGGTIVGVAVLVLGLATLFSRRLTRPLAAATAAARALGREEPFEVHPSQVVEINAVNEALGAARDELAARSAALRRSEQQLRSAADAAQFGAHEYDVATDRVIRSPQLRRILGVVDADTAPPFESGLAFVHPEDREEVGRRKRAIIAGGEGPYQLEYRIRRPDGVVRWVMDRGQATVDPATGGIGRVVGVLLDITDLKEAEQRQRLLFDELNHRVKNTLAIVQSLAQQTMRTRSDPKEFARAFEDRLGSLARAHNLLTRESWTGASLHDIVDAAMAPFADGGRVIEVEGDEVIIPAGATITLSLMLHELAANSAKYGALAAADGRLSIGWRVGSDLVAAEIDLVWEESGGATVVVPASTGFGSRLLKASARQLDARLEMDFAPAGLRCRLQFTVPRAGA